METINYNFTIADASYDGVKQALWTKLILLNELFYQCDHIVSSSVINLELDEVVFNNNARGGYGSDTMGWLGDVLVKISYGRTDNQVIIELAGTSDEEINAALDELKSQCSIVKINDDSIKVGFWSLTAQGPAVRERAIQVPTWDAINENYSRIVNGELEWLMEPENVKTGSGKLILWHGKPGTGKTWAIRAMMERWKKDYSFQYIIDPENFFGSSTSYMMEVIMNSNHSYSSKPNRKWNLIILEDTGELLSADAKNRAGQGLSRLLNVVDGLIGQGLNTTFLITTNEELDSLHPAVVRPGRCLSNINFGPLDPIQATNWMKSRGGGKVTDDKTLAELYALANGNKLPDGEQGEKVSKVSTGVYL